MGEFFSTAEGFREGFCLAPAATPGEGEAGAVWGERLRVRAKLIYNISRFVMQASLVMGQRAILEAGRDCLDPGSIPC